MFTKAKIGWRQKKRENSASHFDVFLLYWEGLTGKVLRECEGNVYFLLYLTILHCCAIIFV